MLQTNFSRHTFLCLSRPRPLWKWLTKTRDNKLGLFYVALLNVTLYIQWGRFIIVHVTLPTPSHQVTSNFMLDFKRLHLNPLNIMTLLTLKVVLGYHHTRLKTILTIFNSKLSRSILAETIILLSQIYLDFQKKLSLNLFIRFLVMYLSPD